MKGKHMMPGGHMMSDKEMKKMMSEKGKKKNKKKISRKTYGN